MTRWSSHNVAEILGLARSADRPSAAGGRWPRARMLVWIIGLGALVLLLGGWLLSFVNSVP
jgi:hypothetical protein